ncbi:MAG: DUF488 domain-containing protein [Thermoplasmata archaeon]
MNTIEPCRVYQFNKTEEFAILVDRLWPRGLRKGKIKIDYWAKDFAPSNNLRIFFNHDITRWEEFKFKYFEELDNNVKIGEFIGSIKKILKERDVVFLYAAKDQEHNNAIALREYVMKHL